jgi:hypothetical protein
MLQFNGANQRVSGFELRCAHHAIRFHSAATFGIVDHCYFISPWHAIAMHGLKGPAPTSPLSPTPGTSTYGSDHTFQYNHFVDSGLRAAFGSPSDTSTGLIPWDWIKYTATGDGGLSMGRTGDNNESFSIWGSGGAKRCIIRYNTIDGYFNGIGGYSVGFDRYSGMDNDIHDNLLTNLADDGFEYEPNGINWRIWNNTVKWSAVFISIARANYGPVYIWRNSGFQMGTAEIPIDLGGNKGVAAPFFKINGGHDVSPMVHIFHNTWWSNQALTAANRGFSVTNGGLSNPPHWDIRNNIIRAYDRSIDWDEITPTDRGTAHTYVPDDYVRWSEDYNLWVFSATPTANNGHVYNGAKYQTQAHVATYRTDSDSGTNSNKLNSVDIAFSDEATIDGLLTDPTAGDLTLKAGTNHAVGAGVLIPNINDVSGDRDLGYLERS